MAAPLSLVEPGLAWSALSALVSGPVEPSCRALHAAVGCTLAQDLVTPGPIPAAAAATRDGWAVMAASTAGASPYAPVPLPAASWVEAGDPLPAGADAVLEPFDVEGAPPSALRDAAAGEGMRAQGEDAAGGWTWRRHGDRLRATDLPLLTAGGAATVLVRRPVVSILPLGDEFLAGPDRETLGRFVACLVEDEGAAPRTLTPAGDDPGLVAAGLRDGAHGADLVLTLGGTGAGRGDQAAAGLAAAGQLLLHGLGAVPGRTAGFGVVEGCPVIMLPGRVEDAFAAWLLLARPLLRRLCAAPDPPPRRVRLARKITSMVGLAEIVLLRRVPGEPELAEPLATGSLPLAAFAQADAVLIVPHGSEGYERGRWVEVQDMPGARWISV